MYAMVTIKSDYSRNWFNVNTARLSIEPYGNGQKIDIPVVLDMKDVYEDSIKNLNLFKRIIAKYTFNKSAWIEKYLSVCASVSMNAFCIANLNTSMDIIAYKCLHLYTEEYNYCDELVYICEAKFLVKCGTKKHHSNNFVEVNYNCLGDYNIIIKLFGDHNEILYLSVPVSELCNIRRIISNALLQYRDINVDMSTFEFYNNNIAIGMY